MKIKNKSLAIFFILAILLVAINVYFELIDKTELVNQILAALLLSFLVSYAFISKEVSYLKNVLFFITMSMFTTNLALIIRLLLKLL